MRHLLRWTAIFLAVVAVALVGVRSNFSLIHSKAEAQGLPVGIPIGLARLAFDFSHAGFYGAYWVRAFTATGSMRPECIVAVGETNFGMPGINTFCGPREYNGQSGLMISVAFPQGPIPYEFFMSVNVYQMGAKGYAAPVYYPGD